MMRKIVFFMDAGICGTDCYEGYSVPRDMTDSDLDNTARELAMNHAGSYGDVMPEDEWDYDNEHEISEVDVNYFWSDYDPEKHDGHMLDNTFPQL